MNEAQKKKASEMVAILDKKFDECINELDKTTPGTDAYLKVCASIKETLALLAIAPREED